MKIYADALKAAPSLNYQPPALRHGVVAVHGSRSARLPSRSRSLCLFIVKFTFPFVRLFADRKRRHFPIPSEIHNSPPRADLSVPRYISPFHTRFIPSLPNSEVKCHRSPGEGLLVLCPDERTGKQVSRYASQTSCYILFLD